jgi:hypothetical protein
MCTIVIFLLGYDVGKVGLYKETILWPNIRTFESVFQTSLYVTPISAGLFFGHAHL